MQYLMVSQGMAEKRPSLITPSIERQKPLLVWFGHSVPTAFGDYAVFMEDESRFCLVLRNPPATLVEFRQAFTGQLQQSVLWLTQVSAKTAKRVKLGVQDLCTHLCVGVGLEYSVSGDLFEIGCQLQGVLDEAHSSLPSEQTLAQHLNYATRLNGDNKEVLPVEEFRDFWCRKLGISPQELNTSLS